MSEGKGFKGFVYPEDVTLALSEAFEEERTGYNDNNMERLCAGAAKVFTLFARVEGLFVWELYKYLTTLYLVGSSFKERSKERFKDPKVKKEYDRINKAMPVKNATPLLPLIGAILFAMLGVFLFRSSWAGDHTATVIKVILCETAALGALLGWGFSYLTGNPHWGAGVAGAIFGYIAGGMVIDWGGKAVSGKLPMILVVEAGLGVVILIFVTIFLMRERVEYHQQCKADMQFLREHKSECEVLQAALKERIDEFAKIIQWIESGKRWDGYDAVIKSISENVTYENPKKDKRNRTITEIEAGINDCASILKDTMEMYRDMEKELAKRYKKV